MPFNLAEAGGNNPIDVPRKDFRKIIIGILAFILGIILYTLEIRHFNNTFEVKNLLIFGAILGLLVGLFLGYKMSHFGKESIEVFQIYFIITILSIIFMPLLVSLSNRWLSFHSTTIEKVEFVESNAYFASRFGNAGEPEIDGYHTFFIRKGKLERIDSKKAIFPNAKKREMVDLPVKKGLWGFTEVILP